MDTETQIRMFLSPLAAMLRSRKVMTALAAVIVAILVGLVPELENVRVELIVLVGFLGSVLMGSIAAEDNAERRLEAARLAALTPAELAKETTTAVIDELAKGQPAAGETVDGAAG